MANRIIDILAHADFSGQLRKTKRTPGYAAFCANVEALRAENPEGTLLLDAGDEFSTDFWGGAPMVKAVALNKTDAMTLGNHEFDHGQAVLEENISACTFPVLCANMVERATGELVRGAKPFVMLEKQGARIGILGLTTEYTPYMVERSAFAPFEARSAIDAGNKYIPIMREQGAEIIIVLSHFPFYVDDDGAISGELYDVMQSIPHVDVFIGGHIPGDFAAVVDGTAVLKAGFGGKSLARARLSFNDETRRVEGMQCSMSLTDRAAEGPAAMAAYEEEVTGPFSAFFDEQIAMASEEWQMRLARESKLGDFIADCMRNSAKTELAYMNATSSGGKLIPGPITREDITSVCGFNDPIMTGEITGEQLYRLFELVYEPERFGNNAGLIFSGFSVTVDHTRPAGQKVLAISLPSGAPIERGASYTVATSRYMASGGNDTSLVASNIKWRDTGVGFYNAAFAHAEALGELRVGDFPRLIETGTPENDNSPF